jgi:hypothetical protein
LSSFEIVLLYRLPLLLFKLFHFAWALTRGEKYGENEASDFEIEMLSIVSPSQSQLNF